MSQSGLGPSKGSVKVPVQYQSETRPYTSLYDFNFTRVPDSVSRQRLESTASIGTFQKRRQTALSRSYSYWRKLSPHVYREKR